MDLNELLTMSDIALMELKRAVSREIKARATVSVSTVAVYRAAHLTIDRSGFIKMTSALATRLRKEEMKACGCRLCFLALYPPKTFAEWAEKVGGSSDAWPPTTHGFTKKTGEQTSKEVVMHLPNVP